MVAADQAIRRVFEDAKGCIEGWNLTSETVHYWSVYLTALDAVAIRAGARDLAAEIIEFRTSMHSQ